MGSRESYDDALAQRLALLRAELMGEHLVDATPERVRTPAEPRATEEPHVTAVRMPGRHASRHLRGAGRLPSFLLAPGPVAVVAVLLALGLAVAAWLALRSRPVELPLAAPVAGGLATPVVVAGASTGAEAGAASGGGAGRTSGAAELVVHVAGKVRRPGIVVLSPGSRVIDALRTAGGARPGANLAGLNLARPLVDGEQVLVGVGVPAAAAEGAVGGTAGDAAGKVNLNTASAAQLEELPGVGPVTAASIVAFREEHGAFSSVDQLLDVSGIGEATLAEIAPHATV